MPTSPRLLLFALALAAAFLSPTKCPADVMPRMPTNIVVSKMADHGDLIFVLFVDGTFEKGVLLDPKREGAPGNVYLPPELPRGKLQLLGVPRALVDKSKKSPDPAWLKDGTPGVVRVAGVIHHYPVEKSAAQQRYELEKADGGLKLTLLNPDVLEPYPPEDWMLEKETPPYLWIGIGAAALVLIGVVVAVWTFRRRGSEST